MQLTRHLPVGYRTHRTYRQSNPLGPNFSRPGNPNSCDGKFKEDARMRTAQLLMVLGFTANSIVGSLCHAGKPDPAVESVLAKWEDASKKCRSLDAKVTVYRYDPVFRDNNPIISHGRVYYEAPNFARYEIGIEEGQHGKATGSWRSQETPETIVWTDNGLFYIDHRDKTCRFSSSEGIQFARKRLEQMPENSVWERFCKKLSQAILWPTQFTKPDDVLFLNTDTHAKQQRFDFTAENREGKIMVKAVPKGALINNMNNFTCVA